MYDPLIPGPWRSQIQRQKAGRWAPGAGGEGCDGELSFKVAEFQFGKMEKVLATDGGLS